MYQTAEIKQMNIHRHFISSQKDLSLHFQHETTDLVVQMEIFERKRERESDGNFQNMRIPL